MDLKSALLSWFGYEMYPHRFLHLNIRLTAGGVVLVVVEPMGGVPE